MNECNSKGCKNKTKTPQHKYCKECAKERNRDRARKKSDEVKNSKNGFIYNAF